MFCLQANLWHSLDPLLGITGVTMQEAKPDGITPSPVPPGPPAPPRPPPLQHAPNPPTPPAESATLNYEANCDLVGDEAGSQQGLNCH